MANTQENSYRNIFKGISIFGGVKVFEMFINLLRGKFIAMILGPQGMGISSIFYNSMSTISQFSSLGLNLAIVNEIAAAKESDERKQLIIDIAYRLFSITSLIGALFCIIFAPWLSNVSFGSEEFAWQFRLLAVAVFFTTYNTGKLSILQGLHEVKRLSKASLIGSVIGLCVGVPLFYLFGNKGIVPSIAAIAISVNIFYSWNLRKVNALKSKTTFSWKQNKPTIVKVISLGGILVISALLGSLCNYIISIFIRYYGNLDSVGFFQAANSVTNQLTAVVFSSMALDYMPRLAAIASDNRQVKDVVNRQSEIIAWVIAPIAIFIILFAPLIISILFTQEFSEVIPLLRLMAIGVVLKAFNYSMGYIAFAKGDRKLFFWLEGVGCNITYLLFNLIFFFFFGLIGLGYAFIADQALCFFIYIYFTHRFYQYKFSSAVVKASALTLALSIFAFSLLSIQNTILQYSLISIIAAISVACSAIKIKRLIKK